MKALIRFLHLCRDGVILLREQRSPPEPEARLSDSDLRWRVAEGLSQTGPFNKGEVYAAPIVADDDAELVRMVIRRLMRREPSALRSRYTLQREVAASRMKEKVR